MTAIAAIAAQNRAGAAIGIASWCTAHAETLRAILRSHRDGDEAILIEATCNQVNQHGGYTGMTPGAFRAFVEDLAAQAGVAASRIIFGGDHLGPNPWKSRPAAEAMSEARAMVQAYVEAGFTKIHLDASMACADDGQLGEALMAERATDLCAVAEAARGARRLSYVIGTEVPIPGGETAVLDTLAVTAPEAVLRTYALHRQAFARRGLAEAFVRVVGLVVQPGVDFGNAQVFAFDKYRAATLSRPVMDLPGLVFEAHSTDYQTAEALRGLVAGHFAILKVGPELTFAFREAVMAMAAIEAWLDVPARSGLAETIRQVMIEDPRYWRDYVPPGREEDITRFFGLSDRVRYYWPNARIASAVRQLRANIDGADIPPGLAAQYAGKLEADQAAGPLSERIIQGKVGAVVEKYRSACGSIRAR